MSEGPVPYGATALPYDLLMRIQQGVMAYTYKGVPALKNPFDLALYALLLWREKPRTIVEIGSHAGGAALWLADQLTAMGIDGHVYSVDIEPVLGLADPRISFLAGDGRALAAVLPRERVAALPRPLLVIEDADHHRDTTAAVLAHFAPLMAAGEYIVVEDAILAAMRVADLYGGGPGQAIAEFLAAAGGTWEVDRAYCDYFGRNLTWNTDGYLRKVR